MITVRTQQRNSDRVNFPSGEMEHSHGSHGAVKSEELEAAEVSYNVRPTPIITNFMVFITIVARAYKLTYNWGGHIASEELSCGTPSHHPVVFFHDYELVLNLY